MKHARSTEIEEMMLAKTVLAKKNDLLDARERTVAELRGRVKQQQREIDELRQELAEAREWAREEGVHGVVSDVLALASSYDAKDSGVDAGLARRLIRLFQERYGLEVIDRQCRSVDPRVHQVIEVVRCQGTCTVVEIRERGFRLGGRPIRPALVKVFQGD